MEEEIEEAGNNNNKDKSSILSITLKSKTTKSEATTALRVCGGMKQSGGRFSDITGNSTSQMLFHLASSPSAVDAKTPTLLLPPSEDD